MMRPTPSRRPPGRPPKPVARPEVPEQARPDAGLTWYVVVLKPGADAEKARLGLIAQGYAAWCPYALQSRYHARCRSIVLRAFWNPYLFLGVAPDQGIDRVAKVPAIASLVRDAKGVIVSIEPAKLAHCWDELQAMGGCYDQTRAGSNRHHHADGTLLRIKSGAFAGFPGQVLNHTGERLRMLVAIFGRPTTVEIDQFEVEQM
ncbi:MAG: hypothetical protein KBC46_03410 [Ferrovibrio sp.]|nr:hypothetical protein [Ferrovibrio sp.]